jgi:hypothetical protein
MLKFKIGREEPITPPPLSGQQLGYELMAGPDNVWINDFWPEQQSTSWIYVDRLAGHNKPAASLLHGLELGIVAAARWIAIELLKDPAPPANCISGVGLWLVQVENHEPPLMALWSPLGELGVVGVSNVQPTHVWGTSWWISCPLAHPLAQSPSRSYASSEQALATLIEHTAPWIAAALAKEVQP